jgi:hypothetical protein
LKAADWSIYLGSTATVLTGDLTVSGTLTAATTVSNVVNGKFVEVDSELLTQSACSSYFNGPLYANAGFTGATGAFTSLSVAGVDVKSLTTYQARNTNLNNFNQLASVQSSLWSGFTPKDNITWVVGNGTYTNNYANITNAWGVVENIAVTLNLNATPDNLTLPMTGVTAGLSLVVKVWVKLGTATNFNISFNNNAAWNTVGGRCWTSSELSTSVWTQISIQITTPSGGSLNIQPGSHGNSGQTQQTTGTVFVYGWQVFQLGNTSTLETNLVVDGSLRCTSEVVTGNLSCASLTVNSIAMPTPAYMRAQLSTATYPGGVTSDITWTSVMASTITMVSSPGAPIRLPAIGVYLISGKLSVQTALNSACALDLQTSTDSTTWSTPSICQLASVPANSDFNISAFLLTTTVVNQQIKVIFVNTLASNVTFGSGNSVSFVNIIRIA